MTGNAQGALALDRSFPEFSFSFENYPLRIVMRDGEPWFVAIDLCIALRLKWKGSGSTGSLAALDDDEKGVVLIDTSGGKQNIAIVSESGLYTLILRCRDAVNPGTVPYRFRKWVTSEVLPAIRKTGRYEAPAAPAPEYLSSAQMRTLSYLVGRMAKCFHYEQPMCNAIWKALRAATGCPSPQRFETRHASAIVEECRRMMRISFHAFDVISRAENTLIRRAFRNGENADIVLADIKAQINKDMAKAEEAMPHWFEDDLQVIAGNNAGALN